jgi:hypothetical protein
MVSFYLQNAYFEVGLRGFEPLTSAVQRRYDSLLEVSGVCRYPANEQFSASSLFPAFQEIYSGCCTVAAHPAALEEEVAPE